MKLEIRHIVAGNVLLLCFYLWLGAGPCRAADDLYEARLNKGLFNTEPYSYLLMEKARMEKGRAREYLLTARKYSPDLPAVYFELAWRGSPASLNGIFERIDYFRQGLKAYERNFWWLFNLSGLLSLGLIISYVLSLSALLAIRFPMEYRLLSHDIGEDGKKLISLVLLVLLSFFGFFVFVAGVLFLFGLYFRPKEKALVYLALMSLLLSPAATSFAKAFLSPPSPELRAIVAVNEGKDNGYALMTLKGSGDFASVFSYALALKREGRYEEAVATYKRLIGQKRDALIYTNLGNAYYAANDLEAAKEAYRSAVAIKPLPSAYYNLSQVLRGTLDFVKGDEYFLAAAKLDPEAVSRFTSLSSSNPNRFVVDEPLPMSALWEYARGKSGSPGLRSLAAFGVAILLIPAFYILSRRMEDHAYRCKRCGEVYCSNCSKSRTWGGMCPQCYKFFVRVEELDSRERIARLSSLYQRQTRRRRTIRLLSYAIPGAGQIYAGRILSGVLFLWPFLFSFALLALGRFPFSGLSPFNQSWLELLAVISTVLVYALSIFNMRKGIQKGWL